MSFQRIPLNSGVYLDDSPSEAAGYFVASDKIRFRNGVPEVMSGWEAYSSTLLNGKCRGLHTWGDNTGVKWAIAGTHLQLYILTDGAITDCTPIASHTAQSSLTFTTTNGSATVTLNFTNHGMVGGQRFQLENVGQSSIGGTLIAGTFTVNASNLGASTLTYSAASSATASAGPSVIVCDSRIYLAPGLQDGAAGLGFGTGYFSGSVGSGTTWSTPTTGTNYPRTWSVDNFGQNALASPRGGGLYELYPQTAAPELTTNGTFTGSAAGWTLGAGWVYGANNVNCTVGATNPTLSQSITLNAAAFYEIEFDASAITSGNLKVTLGSTTVLANQTLTAQRYKLQAYGGNAGGAQTLSFIGQSLGATIDTVTVTQIINAQLVPNAPTQNTCMIVTAEKFVMLGGTIELATGLFNPMHLRWSNIADDQTWTPASTNLSSFYTLGEGSRIVGMKVGNGEMLVWTDSALYAGTYVADRGIVYSFRLVGHGCGLIGPNAAAIIGGAAFWLSPGGTCFTYSGGSPVMIKSSIDDDMMDHLAAVQQDKIFAAPISKFGDVIWLYPDSRDGTNECSRYVLLCSSEAANNPSQQPGMGVWAPGTFTRTAWTDAGVFEYPLAVGTDGTVYYQEKGDSANGGSISWSLETADLLIGNDDTLSLIRSFIPDFAELAGGAQLIVTTSNYNQSPTSNHGPFNFTIMTEKLDVLSDAPVGRRASFTISGSSSPASMRAGQLLFDVVDTGMQF